MNDVKSVGDLFDNAWKFFIKPNRGFYNDFDIPVNFGNGDNMLVSDQFELVMAHRGNKVIKGIIYHPYQVEKDEKIIIYLHSQGGTLMEGLFLLNLCAHYRICLCVFDSFGCGKSDGEFVTLGVRESEDLDKLVLFIQRKYKIFNISLWGRSMGAVTSLIYCNRHAFNITSIVCDSPFLNLERSVSHIVGRKMGISPFFVGLLLGLVRNKILTKVGVDLLELNLERTVKNMKTPTLLIGSKVDELVPLEDFEFIFKNYGTRQIKFIQTNSEHNEIREEKIIAAAFISMAERLNVKITSRTKVYQLLCSDNPYSRSSLTNDQILFNKPDNFNSQKFCEDIKEAFNKMNKNTN